MTILITKNVFDGGTCTTLKSDPKMVAMRHPETDEFVFMEFIGGRGWEVIRNMNEEEIKEFTADETDEMTAQDAHNNIEKFEITAAARISGAIAVRPADQGTTNTGWVLMPDADTADIDGVIVDMDPSDFINSEGHCYDGDDEFNSWVENHAQIIKAPLGDTTMNTLSEGSIITGFYGKDGAMTPGWDSKEEAKAEFNAFYQDAEYEGCEVIFYNGSWVIAY